MNIEHQEMQKQNQNTTTTEVEKPTQASVIRFVPKDPQMIEKKLRNYKDKLKMLKKRKHK